MPVTTNTGAIGRFLFGWGAGYTGLWNVGGAGILTNACTLRVSFADVEPILSCSSCPGTAATYKSTLNISGSLDGVTVDLGFGASCLSFGYHALAPNPLPITVRGYTTSDCTGISTILSSFRVQVAQFGSGTFELVAFSQQPAPVGIQVVHFAAAFDADAWTDGMTLDNAITTSGCIDWRGTGDSFPAGSRLGSATMSVL